MGQGAWTGAVAGSVGFVAFIVAGWSEGSSDGGTGALVAIGFLYAVVPGAAIGFCVATLVSVVIALLRGRLRTRVASAAATVVGLAILAGCFTAWLSLSLFSQAGWAMAFALSGCCTAAVLWRAPPVLRGFRSVAPVTG